MSELAGHTIHRKHIHHGWNNAFEPCLRIAPGIAPSIQTGPVTGLTRPRSSFSRSAAVEVLVS